MPRVYDAERLVGIGFLSLFADVMAVLKGFGVSGLGFGV